MTKLPMNENVRFPIVLVILAIAVVGCAEPRGEVAGKVTFEGEPLAEGVILFVHADSKVRETTEIRNGQFEVKTYEGAGLPLGEYQFAIFPPEPPPPTTGVAPPPLKEYPDIPARYRDISTSGGKFTLTANPPTINFDMKK